jgi:hypothetical protein
MILGASVVYLVTVYSDTWGSLTDLLTAVAAGFGTAIAVQWAALPIFQSLRLRAAGSGDAAKASSAEEAG